MCLFFILMAACVNKKPPIEEWNLARVAYSSAQDSDAKRYAPKRFIRAQGYLRKAERAFKERYYEKSTVYFRKSRYYSEKAENIARIKMLMQGGME